ncbi:21469_t:CDS:1, partial [Gigaspora margarita]
IVKSIEKMHKGKLETAKKNQLDALEKKRRLVRKKRGSSKRGAE